MPQSNYRPKFNVTQQSNKQKRFKVNKLARPSIKKDGFIQTILDGPWYIHWGIIIFVVILISLGYTKYKQSHITTTSTQQKRVEEVKNYKADFKKKNKVDTTLEYSTPDSNKAVDDYGPQTGAPQTYLTKQNNGSIPDYITKLEVDNINYKSIKLKKPCFIIFYQGDNRATEQQNAALKEYSDAKDANEFKVYVIDINKHTDAQKNYTDYLSTLGQSASIPPVETINAIFMVNNEPKDMILKQNQKNNFTLDNMRNMVAQVNDK